MSKIVATDKNRKPVYENLELPITLNDWYNWVKYANMHGFESIQVIGIVKDGVKFVGNDLKENKELVNKYQAELEAVIKPKVNENEDIKSQLESQKQANAELLKRLEALESLNIKDGNVSAKKDITVKSNVNKMAEVLKAKYKELYGKNPSHLMKEEGFIEKIKEKLDPIEFDKFVNEL